MSGNIYQFGTTALPSRTPRWTRSIGVQNQLVKVLGGVYDPWRSEQAPADLSRPITVSALALAASRTALGAALDAYRGLLGKRDRLWLDPYDAAQVDRWCWARLIDVSDVGSYKDRIWQPVDLVFQPLTGWSGHAYGGAWNLDTGYLFDNGLYLDSSGAVAPGTNVLANAGNRAVTNCGIRYTAAGNRTNLKLTAGSCEWQISSLTTGDVLTVDCGAKTVLINGANNYYRFSLTANHRSPYWLMIASQGSTVTWTNHNAADAVVYTYSDGWQ